MKTRKNDWLIKATYITRDCQYVIRHIDMFNYAKEEVYRYAHSLDGCFSVSIYKLESMLQS